MIRVGIILAFIATIVVFFLHRSIHPETGIAKPATDLGAWHWLQTNGSSAGLSIDQGALKADILQVSGDPYDLELYQIEVPLKEGQKYRLTFDAKASVERTVLISCGEVFNLDKKGMGLMNTVRLDTKWQSFDFSFKANHVDGDGSPTGRKDKLPWFLLGKATGVVWIKNLVVTKVDD